VSAHLFVGEAIPAAPAAVGLALAVAGLLAFTAFLVASGMLKLYAETLGAFIRWLAKHVDVDLHIPHFGGHPFRAVSHGLYAVDNQIRNAFAAAALRSESAASWCFATAGHIITWMATEIADISHDLWTSLQHTTVSAIPAAIRRAEAATLARLRGIDHAVGRIEAMARAQLARLRVGIDRLGHRLEAKIGTAIRGVGSRVGRLERTVKADGKRLTRVEAKWKIGAFAGLVSIALARLGLKWLRCGNVRRAGRQLCGMDTDLLESLLGASLLLTSAISLRQLARELEEPTALVSDGLAKLIREL
jgi:hypothetical protein